MDVRKRNQVRWVLTITELDLIRKVEVIKNNQITYITSYKFTRETLPFSSHELLLFFLAYCEVHNELLNKAIKNIQ